MALDVEGPDKGLGFVEEGLVCVEEGLELLEEGTAFVEEGLGVGVDFFGAASFFFFFLGLPCLSRPWFRWYSRSKGLVKAAAGSQVSSLEL